MSKSNRSNMDHVRAVGEVNGDTIQVLEPIPDSGKYVWRIIRKEGARVDSGMIVYTSIDDAFQAAVHILIPDAIPVEFTEPGEDDFRRLNLLLFGFKKAGPIVTFSEAMIAHRFLIEALETLKLAQEKMPTDYDEVIDACSAAWNVPDDLESTARSLKELAMQSQAVMIELCERDLETLSSFIAAFLHL